MKLDLNLMFHAATDATLKFDVELMRIDPAPPQVNYFKLIDVDKNNFLSNEEVIS